MKCPVNTGLYMKIPSIISVMSYPWTDSASVMLIVESCSTSFILCAADALISSTDWFYCRTITHYTSSCPHYIVSYCACADVRDRACDTEYFRWIKAIQPMCKLNIEPKIMICFNVTLYTLYHIPSFYSMVFGFGVFNRLKESKILPNCGHSNGTQYWLETLIESLGSKISNKCRLLHSYFTEYLHDKIY